MAAMEVPIDILHAKYADDSDDDEELLPHGLTPSGHVELAQPLHGPAHEVATAAAPHGGDGDDYDYEEEYDWSEDDDDVAAALDWVEDREGSRCMHLVC